MKFSSVKRNVRNNISIKCRECSLKNRAKKMTRWDTESAKAHLVSMGSDLIGEYVTERKGHCHIKCCVCKKPIYKSWGKIQSGKNRCRESAMGSRAVKLNVVKRDVSVTKWTLTSVKDYIRVNTRCRLLSKNYTRASNYLSLKCHCGNKFKRRFDGILRAIELYKKEIGCPECSKCIKWTDELLKEYISKNTKSTLFKKEEYKNNRSPLTLQCECGDLYKRTFKSIQENITKKHNVSCPKCRISSGEKLVGDLLDSLCIDYEREKIYDGLVGEAGKSLRYDFAVKSANEVFCLIEYDGIQHFQPVDIWGGEGALKRTKERDLIKNRYAQNTLGLSIIRIPYWKTEEEVKGIIKEITKEIV